MDLVHKIFATISHIFNWYSHVFFKNFEAWNNQVSYTLDRPNPPDICYNFPHFQFFFSRTLRRGTTCRTCTSSWARSGARGGCCRRRQSATTTTGRSGTTSWWWALIVHTLRTSSQGKWFLKEKELYFENFNRQDTFIVSKDKRKLLSKKKIERQYLPQKEIYPDLSQKVL